MNDFIKVTVRSKENGQTFDSERLINLSRVTEIKPALEGNDWCIFKYDTGYALVNISLESAIDLLVAHE